MCVWQSMSPGSSVAFPSSIASSVPPGALVRTDSIVSPEITTHTGPFSTPAFTSTQCAAWITMWRGGTSARGTAANTSVAATASASGIT